MRTLFSFGLVFLSLTLGSGRSLAEHANMYDCYGDGFRLSMVTADGSGQPTLMFEFGSGNVVKARNVSLTHSAVGLEISGWKETGAADVSVAYKVVVPQVWINLKTEYEVYGIPGTVIESMTSKYTVDPANAPSAPTSTNKYMKVECGATFAAF